MWQIIEWSDLCLRKYGDCCHVLNHKATPFMPCLNVRKSHEMTHRRAKCQGIVAKSSIFGCGWQWHCVVTRVWLADRLVRLCSDAWLEIKTYVSNCWYTRVFAQSHCCNQLGMTGSWGSLFTEVALLITPIVAYFYLEVVHIPSYSLTNDSLVLSTW